MAMNLLHRRHCSSAGWEKAVANQLLPWALQHVELGPRTLEIGPGYGATLQALLGLTASLTAVEVDNSMVERLNRRYGQRARIIRGDGTQTGLPDDHFTTRSLGWHRTSKAAFSGTPPLPPNTWV